MAEKQPLGVAKRPCGSCPYRKDVPSGVWSENEYQKLPDYDNDMPEQPQARFDCHQRDGNLCAGWLACHGPENLLSLRIAHILGRVIVPEVWTYKTDVPVFASGQEACEHGMAEVDNPGPEALALIAKLQQIIKS